MKVYIERDPLFYPEICYIFSVFAKYIGISFSITSEKNDAEVLISSQDDAHIRVSRSFYLLLAERKFGHQLHFHQECFIRDELGFVDYLSTAFYMLALIQEVDSEELDEFGRFQYKDSYQCKFSVADQNIVAELFNKIANLLPKFDGRGVRKSSVVFLSHDIDSIHGSIFQDSFYCLKKYQFSKLFKVLWSNLFNGPAWFNIDHIMSLESEYDFQSTFYWLVRKGKVNNYLNNSDYNIFNGKVQSQILEIDRSDNWENGLHKSAGNFSFEDELNDLGRPVIGNRYHYLKFKPHTDFIKIENAGLKIDSSLGFADCLGFRNNFGSPYHPYNLNQRQPFSFVECPLHLMDTTFYHYCKVDADVFANSVISFFEQHKSNCVISLLTHNNYYSVNKYENYYKAIRRILIYMFESGIKSISQTDIVKQFSNEHTYPFNA